MRAVTTLLIFVAVTVATPLLGQSAPSGVVGAYLTAEFSGPETKIAPLYFASKDAKAEMIRRQRLIELVASCQNPIAVPLVHAQPGDIATLVTWQDCGHGDDGVMSAEFLFKNGQLASVNAFEFPLIPLSVLAPSPKVN